MRVVRFALVGGIVTFAACVSEPIRRESRIDPSNPAAPEAPVPRISVGGPVALGTAELPSPGPVDAGAAPMQHEHMHHPMAADGGQP